VLGRKVAREDVFLYRLELGSGECFVGVAAISNRIQYRLEIRLSVVLRAQFDRVEFLLRSQTWLPHGWGADEMCEATW
jgi:hypothetical protein